MKVTTKHAKRQRVGAWQDVKKGLFLSRITREGGHIIQGNSKLTGFIETDFADAALILFDETLMTTGVTSQSIVGQVLSKLLRAHARHAVQNSG